jgi:predicted DsbA family dithiol-disulfide isomerase
MVVEVFSDVLCPWCYIGKRRLDTALAKVSRAGQPELVWRSYELIPDAGREPDRFVPQAMAEYMPAAAVPARIEQIEATAATEGLTLDMAGTRQVTSFDAHRLLKLAADRDRYGELADLLFDAHFAEHRVISYPETLAELGAAAGLDAGEVDRLLAGSDRADQVRADHHRAVELGVRAIPSLSIGGRAPMPVLLPVPELVELLESAGKVQT